jgi:hypothetical protein
MNLSLGRFDVRNTDVICDDQVSLALQYSTQWDSFAHIGSLFDADGDGRPEIVYYNGYRGHEHVKGPEDANAGDGVRNHARRRSVSSTSPSRRSRAAASWSTYTRISATSVMSWVTRI